MFAVGLDFISGSSRLLAAFGQCDNYFRLMLFFLLELRRQKNRAAIWAARQYESFHGYDTTPANMAVNVSRVLHGSNMSRHLNRNP